MRISFFALDFENEGGFQLWVFYSGGGGPTLCWSTTLLVLGRLCWGKKRDAPWCSFCSSPGHNIRTCPVLKDMKTNPAAPTPKKRRPGQKRVILEYCCGQKSRIGNRAPKQVDVERLTEQVNLTTHKGLQKAINIAKRSPAVDLWVSIPCTGGSPLQTINAILHPQTHPARMKRHLKLLKLMI